MLTRRELLRGLITAITPGSGVVTAVRKHGDLTTATPVEKFAVVRDTALIASRALSACLPRNPNVQQTTPAEGIEATLEVYRQKEAELEPLVDRLENGFAKFNEATLPILAASARTPAEVSLILNTFELARINRTNPYRNAYTWRAKELTAPQNLAQSKVFPQQRDFFFFDFLEEDTPSTVAYKPLTRTMQISDSYDPENVLDNIHVLHELYMVSFDTVDRVDIPRSEYEAFHAEPVLKPIVPYRSYASAAAVYMINLFTNDQFRQDVLNSNGDIDVEKYMELLHARPEQANLISGHARIAFKYYSTNSSLTNVHDDFFNYIADLYRYLGLDVYGRTPHGYVLVR